MSKIVMWIVGFVLAFLVKFGVQYGMGSEQLEEQIEASKSEFWPEEFKDGFINSCARTAAQSGGNYEMSRVYCECMADGIEYAEILPMKYNTLKDNQASYTRNAVKEIEIYTSETDEGKELVEECIELVKQEMEAGQRRRHASEE